MIRKETFSSPGKQTPLATLLSQVKRKISLEAMMSEILKQGKIGPTMFTTIKEEIEKSFF